MRALEGYFENGRFFAIGHVAPVPERRRVILTVLDEPIQPNVMDAREWLNEFHRLAASGDEELREEDFPRMRFGRELIDFSEAD